jgi:hypothetical protein|tara:strand:+ start:3011 stop:3373 length:363 start_codon:yes stop_codon:yes gene_type:complete
MGRYYSGDIEGKFVFGVQASDAGVRFGAVEEEWAYTQYIVDREDYSKIKKELEGILASGSVKKVDDFMEGRQMYSHSDLKDAGITEHDMSEWADYGLGKKIKDWFDNNPDEYCLRFEAEM